jgi:mitochondrial chaperone BCS1
LIISSPSPSVSQPVAEKPKSSEKNNFTPPLTPVKSIANGSANGSANGAVVVSHSRVEKIKDEELSPEELSDIAGEFAKQVPDDMFSPAEIQGFLLKRKKEPRRALLEVRVWVEGMGEVKRRGGKVVTVQ